MRNAKDEREKRGEVCFCLFEDGGGEKGKKGKMRGESANKINKLRECKREGGGLWKRKMENEKFGLFFVCTQRVKYKRWHLFLIFLFFLLINTMFYLQFLVRKLKGKKIK
jgi:hypothetical protein